VGPPIRDREQGTNAVAGLLLTGSMAPYLYTWAPNKSMSTDSFSTPGLIPLSRKNAARRLATQLLSGFFEPY
jgi:hypothetical protein